MKTASRFIIAASALALLAACLPARSPNATSTPAAAPTVTPGATSTLALTPTTVPSATPRPRPKETRTAEAVPTVTSQPTAALLSPPPIPQNGAYLGAFVNPAKDTGGGTGWISQLPQFQADLGGKLPGILNFYVNFVDPVPTSDMQVIEAKGSVPLISWACKDVSAIAAGQYDQPITQYANGLKAFGHPVFVRWFWEMNEAHAQPCLGSAGASGYVAAWKHLYALFHQAGATNVALVWCPGGGDVQSMGPFFPGADYVDWIGIDDYLRQGKKPSSFADLFMRWYAAYAQYGKPLMVAETGAQPTEQAAYFDGIGQSVPTQFPALKAILYFDAAGPDGDWGLSPAGLAAFAQLMANPYFSFHQ